MVPGCRGPVQDAADLSLEHLLQNLHARIGAVTAPILLHIAISGSGWRRPSIIPGAASRQLKVQARRPAVNFFKQLLTRKAVFILRQKLAVFGEQTVEADVHILSADAGHTALAQAAGELRVFSDGQL